jgi:predicted DsbA family dithiol-disulfide isomerase
MSAIDFYFDPGCPWAYVTSIWAREVAALKGLDIRWRAFSLRFKNAPEGEQPKAPSMGNRCLRVVLAVREAHGEDAAGNVYTEMGRRRHTAERADIGDPTVLREVLAACDLDTTFAHAADDEARWDDIIRSEMAEAIAKAGDSVGVPIIVLDGGEGPAWFGPVISEAPKGEEALRLWDAFEAVARIPYLYELKRGRTSRPQVDA